MKKIIAVLLSIALMLSCLPLAFGEDYLTGTIWTMTTESLENLLRASNGEVGAALAPYTSFTLDFRVDGTLYTTLTRFSNSKKYTDSWSIFKSGMLELTLLGGNPIIMDYYFDNGCLCLDDGGIVLKFTADGKTYEPAAEAGNPSLPVQGVEGKWKLNRDTLLASLDAAGISEYASMVDSILYTMDFRADGTMIMIVSMFGTEQSYTEEWHYTGANSIYMTIKGAPFNMTFYFENGNLVLNDGISAMVLEPVEDAASSVPTVPGFTTPADKVDLSGNWDAKWFYKYIIEVAAAAGQDNAVVRSLLDIADFTLSLNKDGTATLSIGMSGSSSTGDFDKWSVSGNTFTIFNIPFDFILSGDTLTLFPTLPPCDSFTMTRIK